MKYVFRSKSLELILLTLFNSMKKRNAVPLYSARLIISVLFFIDALTLSILPEIIWSKKYAMDLPDNDFFASVLLLISCFVLSYLMTRKVVEPGKIILSGRLRTRGYIVTVTFVLFLFLFSAFILWVDNKYPS